jgi:hypothetical protein
MALSEAFAEDTGHRRARKSEKDLDVHSCRLWEGQISVLLSRKSQYAAYAECFNACLDLSPVQCVVARKHAVESELSNDGGLGIVQSTVHYTLL